MEAVALIIFEYLPTIYSSVNFSAAFSRSLNKVLRLLFCLSKLFTGSHTYLFQYAYVLTSKFCRRVATILRSMKSINNQTLDVIGFFHCCHTLGSSFEAVAINNISYSIMCIAFTNRRINIIDYVDEAEIMCFAVDTVILIHDKTIEESYIKANVTFNTCKSWFDNNLLKLNLNKTKHIVFSIQNIDIQNKLKICGHSTLCLSNNSINCTCVCIENDYNWTARGPREK
ncbi:Reverse transcriptase domain-containing protein [Aphis craccivora]|uniref:Reverse transcriptase domain-containing protein n=1 Tax=Aphis craccivora TaxID=307492 RepID=A0A6G0Y595_APHCR|nr:Reverse transcriptase domain-containing protein [Aphis craccivora]